MNGGGSSTTRGQIISRWLSNLYVVGLVLVIVAFRCIGERWWPTAVGLYLPRLGFLLPFPFVVGGCLVVGQWLRGIATALVAILLVVFPIMGYRPIGHESRADTTLRIMTWNTYQGRVDNAAIRRMVEEEKPDIFLSQASGHRTKELFRANPGDYLLESDEEFFMATRFPVIEKVGSVQTYGAPPGQFGNYVRYTLKTPLGLVDVYNMHPKSPRGGIDKAYGDGLSTRAKRGDRLDEILQPLKDNIALRRAEVEMTSAAVHQSQHPILVAGDTNLPGLSWLYHHAFADLTDSFDEVGSGLGYTFPAKRPWVRIDRILASAALRFVHLHTGSIIASDHLYLVADVALR